MTKANTKSWFVAIDHFLNSFYGVIHGRWITRTVGNEVSMGIPLHHFCKRSLGRKNLNVTAPPSKVSENTFLNAEIECRNTERRSRIANKVWLFSSYEA